MEVTVTWNNLYYEILNQVIGLGCGAFGMCLRLEGGALSNGISALIKTDTKEMIWGPAPPPPAGVL